MLSAGDLVVMIDPSFLIAITGRLKNRDYTTVNWQISLLQRNK